MSEGRDQNNGCADFVGREKESLRLKWLLGDSDEDYCPPVLVHGPETTGKTVVVKSILKKLGRPYAYTSARACGNPRNCLQSALDALANQNWLRPSSSASDFSSEISCPSQSQSSFHSQVQAHHFSCDKPSDLLPILESHVSHVCGEKTAYWVVDDAESFTETTEGTKFMTFLVQLRHFLQTFNHRESRKKKNAGNMSGEAAATVEEEEEESESEKKEKSCCKLVVILISRVSWESFQQGCSYEENEPLSLFFPAYTVPQLQEILLRERNVLAASGTSTGEWKSFLNLLVPAMSQYTSSIHMLRYLSSKLHSFYFEKTKSQAEDSTSASRSCLSDGGGKNGGNNSNAYAAFKPQLQRVIHHMRTQGMSNVTLSEFFERERLNGLQQQQQQQQQEKNEDLHHRFGGASASTGALRLKASSCEPSEAFIKNLPYIGKMLLLSAYIAGWNPSTSDNRLFGRTKIVKRRKKDPMLMTKKSTKIQDSKLLGPGTFTVDRLMGILKSLYKIEGDCDPEIEDEYDEDYEDYLRTRLHCQETYQLMKTFASFNILSPGSGQMDSGSMHCEHFRLQCNLKEQAAHKIAKSLGINLQDYLLYV